MVELGVMIAVPAATESLAGLGASVIKIEDTGSGDELRKYGSSRNGMSTWFANANSGKRSLSTDLTQKEGKEILWKLLEEADIFVQGFRTGVTEKLGFGYAQTSQRNPSLIYCSSTGFGETGPYRSLPAYDPIIQGLSGWAGIQKTESGPTLHKTMVSDKTAAMYNTQAILAALVQRARTGEGCFIEASMLDSNIMFNWPDVMMQCSLLEDDGHHLPNVLEGYRLYKCKDGYVTVSPGTDKQWEAFCNSLGASSELKDKKLRTSKDRAENIEYFFGKIASLVNQFEREWIVEKLREAGVPAGPVYSPEQVKEDPHVKARGVVVEKLHNKIGKFLGPSPPAKMFGVNLDLSDAPEQGQHTFEILRELGYDETSQAKMLKQGIIKSNRH
ncbi:MAG: hypothetical protein CMQ40_05640 [Gammaproteobacteria bacterium]|nr:hypothetical protein [Gammaproteobacteria bacterium]